MVIWTTLFISGVRAQGRRPNVVLIMADDLGYECIGANGGESYQTPFIDELANTGVRFENCHSQPLCTPSRVQIMTGIYNNRNYTRFGNLDRNQVSFGNLFHDAGYRTVIAGKWQLGSESDSPQHFGFEESCLWQQSRGRTDKDGHDTRYTNPRLDINGKPATFHQGAYGPEIVSDFICHFMEENKDERFFAYYPMILTHCPFVPTPDSKKWDPADRGSLSYKGDPQFYENMVNYMDRMVGKIVAKIDELGLRENTVIIFTGDNGTDQPVISILNGRKYPGGKSYTTDNGTHVPLIVNWKNSIDKGTIREDLVDFSDILPTMCDVAGIDIPSDIVPDGRSFLPALTGQPYKKREWIYSWYDPRGKNLSEWVRNKEYKLYRSGKFYRLADDFFEKNPVDVTTLTGKEKTIYLQLKETLESFPQ